MKVFILAISHKVIDNLKTSASLSLLSMINRNWFSSKINISFRMDTCLNVKRVKLFVKTSDYFSSWTATKKHAWTDNIHSASHWRWLDWNIGSAWQLETLHRKSIPSKNFIFRFHSILIRMWFLWPFCTHFSFICKMVGLNGWLVKFRPY